MCIILASSSPRRKRILNKLGYNFQVVEPKINEKNINSLNPKDYVVDISKKKGLYVREKYPNKHIISGDTIVSFKNKIIGKPLSEQDAFNTLKNFSNNAHYVISALTLTFKNDQITIVDSSKVYFDKISDQQIKEYIEKNNVMDKAGSYNIENANGFLIKNIDGCYNNIVGFPEQKFLKSKIKIAIDKI